MVERGLVLGGKFELLSLIGEGGMGAVWHAKRLDLNAKVAVKILHAHAARRKGALQRFELEARSAAALRSPHVVQVLDYGVDEATGSAFIVMELLEGESLGERLRREGRLSPEETGRWLTHVARALACAHRENIVHRDLKPENVFIVQNEDDELAKVVDFGVAKGASCDSDVPLTATGSVIGTPHYMAPEQVEPGHPIDHRADLWSLAVITCECLTGHRPFNADSFSELAMKIALSRGAVPSSLATVPLGFDQWFERATQAEASERFQSAVEMADAFRGLQTAPQFPEWSADESQATPLAHTEFSDSLDGLHAEASRRKRAGLSTGADNHAVTRRRRLGRTFVAAFVAFAAIAAVGRAMLGWGVEAGDSLAADAKASGTVSGSVPTGVELSRIPSTTQKSSSENETLAPSVEPIVVEPKKRKIPQASSKRKKRRRAGKRRKLRKSVKVAPSKPEDSLDAYDML